MQKVSLADHGKALRLQTGDLIEITLPGNPSTGFRWYIDSCPQELRIVHDNFVHSSAESSGVRQFLIAAEQPGAVELRIRLRRGWENPGASIKQLVLHIDIT
ncbi:MAG TPA: protease inhibitor I42 family protein [Terriglobales bacterium]|jgi:predicted secreted protein